MTGRCPTNRGWSWHQALKGRNQQDYAPLGLKWFREHLCNRALPYPNDYALLGQQAYLQA